LRRYDKIKNIYDYTLSEIVKDHKGWMDFLSFHARIYKHTFEDAVLIYAQRPDATFVADMKTWNQKVGRWIKKGAKSIAVFDNSKSVPALKNYFDIKDTTVREENRFSYPSYWKIDNQSESLLLKRLRKDYDITTVDDYIRDITVAELNKWEQIIYKGIERDIDGTKLSDFDIEKVKNQFKTSLTESIYYMTATRCGLTVNPDFKVISYFDTKPMIFSMGSIVSNISEIILRDIEKEIKIIHGERSVTNETSRTGLQDDRSGISRTNNRSINQSTGDRQVRKQSHELSEGGVPTSIQPTQGRGNIDGNHGQGQRGSAPEDGSTTREDAETRPDTESRELLRELQAQGDDKNKGRGDSPSRDSIQTEIESPVESSDDGSL
jgi:hypothetical protein